MLTPPIPAPSGARAYGQADLAHISVCSIVIHTQRTRPKLQIRTCPCTRARRAQKSDLIKLMSCKALKRAFTFLTCAVGAGEYYTRDQSPSRTYSSSALETGELQSLPTSQRIKIVILCIVCIWVGHARARMIDKMPSYALYAYEV